MKTVTINERFGWLTGLLLFALVVAVFFRESLFLHYSLVPTDVLHHFLLPKEVENEPIEVQNHYPIDQVTQSYPSEIFWQESVKAGEAPLWNPYIFGGHPQLSTSMWGVFCPAKLLLFFCSPERAHTLGYILEFFLAGVFMMAFLGELGLSRWAAFLGGCAYAFNSQFLMLYWLWMNVFAYVPLVLWLFERSLRRNSWGYAVATGCVMTVPLISGSIQMTFFVVFLCGFYALASLWWRPAAERRQAFGQLALIFGLAALAGAIQFLPTLEFLPYETGGRMRNSTGNNLAGLLHTSLGLPALVTFIFPALAGTPETFDLFKWFQGTMMNYAGYIGLVPFVLFAVGAQLKGEKRIRSLLLLIAVVMVVVFFTPLLKFVYHRFFALAMFAMTVLAGYGFDAVLQASSENVKKIHRTFAIISGLVLLVAAALLVVQWYVQNHQAALVEAGRKFVLAHGEANQFRGFSDWWMVRVPRFLNHFRLSNPLFWVPMASAVSAWVCWLAFIRQKINQPLFASALTILAICDLTFLGRNVVPQVDLQRYPLYPPVKVLAKMQADPELFRVYRWMPKTTLTLMDNVLMAYGLSSVSGYESLHPDNFDNFVNHTNGQFNPLLDLQNAKYVLTTISNTLPAERFELAAEAQNLRLYRNKSCLPRLQLVPGWQVVRDRRQILSQLSSGAVNPRETVLLEEEPGEVNSQPKSSGSQPIPAVALIKYSSQKVLARVRAANPGMLLLADTWYPGWKARLDGRPARLYRADYILKAVYVPPGEHEIEYYFAPASFRIGAAISLFTLSGAILWALWRIGRRRGVANAQSQQIRRAGDSPPYQSVPSSQEGGRA